MAFKLTSRLACDVTIITLSGRLELGPGPTTLRETLQDVAARGSRKILLNLSGLSFIDTSGLGALASGHARAQHEGTALKITGLSKRAEQLFQMTGLRNIFDIYDDEVEAIHSWNVRKGGAPSYEVLRTRPG